MTGKRAGPTPDHNDSLLSPEYLPTSKLPDLAARKTAGEMVQMAVTTVTYPKTGASEAAKQRGPPSSSTCTQDASSSTN